MASQQGIAWTNFKLNRINVGICVRHLQTDAPAVTIFAEQLGGSALFRNNAVSTMLHATSLSTVLQLEHVRDM
jgi:hypothetical protein